MCPKRLYTVYLETVLPVAEEPVLIRRCNSGVTCAVTSTHITILLESLPKPGDDTLGDSKFLGYFQLGTSTFQSFNNSTT
ncbi:uncharacterized protein TNCV_2745671 [Trichonephila clavipes]|nr:uncharacterized protein TNCV_2745671 [Trichonephila clavipes]